MPVKYKLGTGDTVDITAITKTNQGSGSGLDSDLLDGLHRASYEELARKGIASGYAPLGADSKVPSSYLPVLALTDVYTVASEAAQLALVAEEGDIAIRTDQSKSYAHNGGTAGTMADWSELLSPTAAVSSVFGRVGAVIAVDGDYSLNLLGDVAITTPASGQGLRYNGASWVNAQLAHGDLSGIGTNTHPQIDTHIGDATIHFLQTAIDHVNLLNKGTNTHAQIDTHLGAVSPHSGHELIVSKNIANGYPGLSAGSKIAGVQITYGTAVDTACVGNDSRLSDARTPTVHKATHEVGGGDLIGHDSLTGFDVTKHRQELIGTLAARPAFGTADRFYFATDTKELFRDTGTAWDRLTTDWADVRNKSIVNAEVAGTAGIVESKLALNFATHSSANDPTATEKAALAGTDGTPSGTNKYLTNSDPRNSNSRTPTAHASTHNGGADPVTPSGIGAIAVPASSAWGDILFRDTSGWTRLPAGTSGLFLKTQGVGANPVWAAGAGGATDFLGLTDTPSAYTGAGGKLVRVNAGATALEFLNETDKFLTTSQLGVGITAHDGTSMFRAEGTSVTWGRLLSIKDTRTDPGGQRTLSFWNNVSGVEKEIYLVDNLGAMSLGKYLDWGKEGGVGTSYTKYGRLAIPSIDGFLGLAALGTDIDINLEMMPKGAGVLYCNGYLKVGSKASLPTPSSAYRGWMARVEGGAGVADEFFVCKKDTSGGYFWQRLDLAIQNVLIKGTKTIWTNMPAALIELDSVWRARADLTKFNQVRLFVGISVAGSASAKVRGQYSTDLTNWYYLDGSTGPSVSIAGGGLNESAWVDLTSGAKADVYFRWIGIDGDGAADPEIGRIELQFR